MARHPQVNFITKLGVRESSRQERSSQRVEPESGLKVTPLLGPGAVIPGPAGIDPCRGPLAAVFPNNRFYCKTRLVLVFHFILHL